MLTIFCTVDEDAPGGEVRDAENLAVSADSKIHQDDGVSCHDHLWA